MQGASIVPLLKVKNQKPGENPFIISTMSIPVAIVFVDVM